MRCDLAQADNLEVGMNARLVRARWHRRAGATLKDVAITVVVVGFCGLVLLAMLPSAGHRNGRNSRLIRDGSQVRGLHQGLVLFAQGNRDEYPLPSHYDKNNTTINPGSLPAESKDTTANVFSTLIYNGFFSPELCVSPAEQNGDIVQDTDYQQSAPKAAAKPEQALWDPAFSADFSDGKTSNFSYAQTHFMGARRAVWSNTFQSTQAAVGNRGPRVTGLSTRLDPILENPKSTTLLIHGGRTTWEGNIAYNDNHVNFETTMSPESTPYPTANKQSQPDCLFFDETDDASTVNNLLTVITTNGSADGDTTTIWD